jgi:hypothetical protein
MKRTVMVEQTAMGFAALYPSYVLDHIGGI